MLALSLKLILAHFIGDFIAQPNKWVKEKREKKLKSKYLYFHVFIHFLLLLTLTGFNTNYFGGILFISISHYVIDSLKLYIEKGKDKKWSFFIDQFLHLLVIGLVVNYYQPYVIRFSWLNETKNLLLFTTLVFATYVTSVILKLLLSKWNPYGEEKIDTNNAGKYIGILERLFIFYFVSINFWEGIGFLLAAKSIFRFGDLKESKDVRLTEYILIGTLLSFGMGILSALIYQNFIN